MDEGAARDLMERAEAFAREVHKDMVRPNRARLPYSTHVGEVADLARRGGGGPEEVAAGWLHDTVEDTPTTLDDIRSRFGGRVAELVDGLTDPPHFAGLPTLERKTLQAERVAGEDAGVRLVKLADQISNVSAVAVDPPVRWTPEKCLSYVEGARRIADACRGVSPLLDRLFDEAYEAAMAAHAPAAPPPRSP